MSKLTGPSAMNAAIDTFGPDAGSGMCKNGIVRIRPKIVIATQFYGWPFSLRGKVEPESPKRLVRECEKRLAEASGDFGRGEWYPEQLFCLGRGCRYRWISRWASTSPCM